MRWIPEEEVQRYVSAKGALRPCEACGHTAFELLNESSQLAIGPTVVVVNEQGVSNRPIIPLTMLGCVNCGYVRNFLTYIILSWLEANPAS